MYLIIVLLRSTQPQMIARNPIVLHQRYTLLSDCNIRSYINFTSVGICASREKINLVGDEILGFAVAPQ